MDKRFFLRFSDRSAMGDLLLSILDKHQWWFVTGGEIGRRMGTSRAAVWKQVGTLLHRGFGIEEARGAVYRLIGRPDMIKEAEVLSLLSSWSFWNTFVFFSHHRQHEKHRRGCRCGRRAPRDECVCGRPDRHPGPLRLQVEINLSQQTLRLYLRFGWASSANCSIASRANGWVRIKLSLPYRMRSMCKENYLLGRYRVE